MSRQAKQFRNKKRAAQFKDTPGPKRTTPKHGKDKRNCMWWMKQHDIEGYKKALARMKGGN